MDGTGRAKNRRGFNLTVRLPHVFYIQDGEHHSLSITQRNLAVVRLQGVHKALANVESDRDGPQDARRQFQRMTNTFIIRLVHKPAERRKGTAQEQLQIADLASR